MRDFYREPVFYYILAPVLIALWPVLVWAIYLPGAQESYANEKGDLAESQVAILEILKLDPDRLSIVDPNDSSLGKFAYNEAFTKAANLSNIPGANWRYSSNPGHESQGKKTQGARLYIDDVHIKQVAKFLSEIQSTWVNLSCNTISLEKTEGMPDQWSIVIDFTYTY